MIGFPTSYDIYLEQDGEKVATVQSYMASKGDNGYKIRLSRVYVVDVNRPLYSLDNFFLVVEKPEPNIDTLCWFDMEEGGAYSEVIGTMFDEDQQ